MQALIYRSPLRDRRTVRRVFADWLNQLRNQSGAYVIRSATTRQVLYVGESHTGNLARTIKRHFYRWKDEPERPHFTADPARVEIAVRITPPPSAVAAQNNLIRRLAPRENNQTPPPF